MAGKTVKLFFRELRGRVQTFRAAEGGNVAVIFALTLLPVMTGVGAAIDYSRANATKEAVQSALDGALLAGAKDGSSTWKTVAANVFSSNLAAKSISFSTPAFSKDDANSFYTGSVTASVPTSILSVIGINSMGVTAGGRATAAEGDNSCILTLDKGQPKSHIALKLNGAPVVNLSGCSIRSNTSVDCNGHDGNMTKTYAAGGVSSCNKPQPGSATVPDTFADLAKNITSLCGANTTGATWTPGAIPNGAGTKPAVVKTGYTEYHICGNLTVSGSGFLTGSAPATDSVIVIENGSLIVANNAVINTARTAIVLTGDNNSSAKIQFPNGAGKQATLTLSPPSTASNPWQAVSLYLDPKLTKAVDNTWGPGAAFNADGLVYLGTSNVVTDGDTASANSKCSKFVMNSFTTNGHVELNFAQVNCAAIGLKQWDGIIVHLIQ
jgi:Putative Flp pilus-assembly TadE/G-like